MKEIVLLLGSNLGDRKRNLMIAKAHIKSIISPIISESSFYLTQPWGNSNQPFYINQAVILSTNTDISTTIYQLNKIEEQLGRTRHVKWGARTLDIDVLYHGKNIYAENGIIIPHKEIANRRFVLACLNELIPDFIHPKLQVSQAELLAQCKDNLEVIPLMM